MENVLSILERERGDAQTRLDDLSGEMRDLKQRIREIDEAVTVLSGVAPTARSSKTGTGRLQDMILKCLNAYGPTGANVREIVFALKTEGRETSEPSTSSTLSRMKADGEVENRQGKWFVTAHRVSKDNEILDAQSVARHNEEFDKMLGIKPRNENGSLNGKPANDPETAHTAQ